MQVVCGNVPAQLRRARGSDGPGLSDLPRPAAQPQAAAGPRATPAAKTAQDWSGGDLDDLIAILSAPAVSARVEVLGRHRRRGHRRGSPPGRRRLGLDLRRQGDRRRARSAARGQADPLPRRAAPPQPDDGDLSEPGPETGTLDGRALAHLMRYCEDYVITCAIDVWRGNETARVEYKRGEISGVTVGGIDAPERLAEVMQWSSGNYRLDRPRVQAAGHRAEARAGRRPPRPRRSRRPRRRRRPRGTRAPPRPSSACRSPRSPRPAPPPRRPRPPPEAAARRRRPARPRPAWRRPRPPRARARASSAPASRRPASRPAATPAPMTRIARQRHQDHLRRAGAAPPEGFIARRSARRSPARPSAAADADASTHRDRQGRPQDRRAQGRRPRAARSPAAAAPAPRPPGRGPPRPAPRPRRSHAPTKPRRAAADDDAGIDSRGGARKRPSRGAPAAAKQPRTRQTPIWTYVGVGFAFGLVLLGIYQLVGLLAH